MNKALENNLRILGVPALSLIGIIFLFIIAGNFVFGRISGLLTEYNESQAMQATLRNKLASLQNNQSQISDFAQSLIAALPNTNSSLLTITQLKSVAFDNGVTLENIGAGAEIAEEEIKFVDVSFDAQGSNISILNFLEQTKTIAPLNKVTRFKLTTSAGASVANVTVRSYWAGLPTKIPAVSDPLQEITADEQRLLQELAGLRQPQFIELSPVPGAGKTNPFSL